MKSILRGILNFLDRKWPDKVVVTQKDYDKLIQRVERLESEINKFNVTMGYGAPIQNGPSESFQGRKFQR